MVDLRIKFVLISVCVLMLAGCSDKSEAFDIRRMSILGVWNGMAIIRDVINGSVIRNDTVRMELDFRLNGEFHTKLLPTGPEVSVRDWYYQLNPEIVIVAQRSPFILQSVAIFAVLTNTRDEQNWHHIQYITDPPSQDNLTEIIWQLSR